MTRRNELIESLCTDLQPVRPTLRPDRLALLWLVSSAVFVVLVTALTGPLREGALVQLLTVPRFAVETLSGLVAIAMLGICAFRAAVPGELNRRFVAASFALLALWLMQYVVGFWSPALAPSLAGERGPCWLETMVFALVPMVTAFVLTRRLYPLNPWHTTALFCLVSGLLPALYMQLACVYLIPHILQDHILPGLIVALLGSALAVLYRGGKAPR